MSGTVPVEAASRVCRARGCSAKGPHAAVFTASSQVLVWEPKRPHSSHPLQRARAQSPQPG